MQNAEEPAGGCTSSEHGETCPAWQDLWALYHRRKAGGGKTRALSVIYRRFLWRTSRLRMKKMPLKQNQAIQVAFVNNRSLYTAPGPRQFIILKKLKGCWCQWTNPILKLPRDTGQKAERRDHWRNRDVLLFLPPSSRRHYDLQEWLSTVSQPCYADGE